MSNSIELKGVSYTYPNNEKPTLKNLTFSVKKGAFVAVMGQTGAGKTTLTLCLNGLIPQLLEGELAGDIIVAGNPVNMCQVQDMSRQIGLVLDDPESQIFGRTVEEDTSFGPANLSLSLQEIQERVKEVLSMVRLKGYEERNTFQLSGGEKQRLAIAGILAMQPEILVLDEPVSELDPVGITEIYKTIDNLRLTKQLTILVTEHNSEEIINRADEVIVLEAGELVWQGTPEDLFRNIPLLNKFGIRPIPVSLIGWDFYQKGWITFDEIPLDVPAAEKTVRCVLSKQNSEGAQRNYKPPTAGEVETKGPVLLKATDLCYQYGPDSLSLKDVNLTIRRGEFVALIGPNGSGKTTLAKHFNGLLKPSQGAVFVDGVNTRDLDTSQLSQVVGYVFQNPDHQIFSETVEKELTYGLKNAGLANAEIKRRVDQVLTFTGLEPYRQEHPLSLGKGKRQLTAVASILALEPKVLVIDEPTTGLDWTGIQKMMTLIKRLHETGTTIVMITHDMELVAKCAQRVIVMKDSRILLDSNPRDVFDNLQLLDRACIIPPQIFRLTTCLKDCGFETNLLHESEFIQAMGQPWEGTACL